VIKIIDNNIYINLKQKDKAYKVIWHFRNYNVILPSPFGFDINNYVDHEIVIDTTTTSYSKLIKNHAIKINKAFLEEVDGEYGFYTNAENTIMEISNVVEVADDDVIFHYVYNKNKPISSRIIIPNALLNNRRYSSVVAYHKQGTIIVTVYNDIYSDARGNYMIKISYPHIGKPLDMNDPRCMQFMENDQMKSLYVRLFLNNI